MCIQLQYKIYALYGIVNTSIQYTTIAQLLTLSSEAPELENVQLVVAILSRLASHYSTSQLRAFVRVPRFVPALLGAVSLAPDQSAVCEPCFHTLRRLFEHRLVVLRTDDRDAEDGDPESTTIAKRKTETESRCR